MNPHTALDSDVRACAKVKDGVRKRRINVPVWQFGNRNVGTPEGAMVFPRIVNLPEGAPLPRARTRHAMEPNAKKPRRRETITLPDDLAAKLGCREVYEDELEARLKVAEEMRLEEDGRLLEAVLSMRLEEFLNALSLSDLSMLSRVNRGCREGVSDLVGESRTRLSVRDYVVSKERLKWARENGCPWGEGVCSAAARGGHLEVLQYARANECPWNEDTCSAAALGGHLDVLQWARAAGCPWKEGTCSAAAGGGHLDVLQWARANGCPWDEATCASAAREGHLEVLQYAHTNECPWDDYECSKAAEGGHLEVLKWARANGCPWNEGTCRAAAGGGHLDVLQWARANGCPWDQGTCAFAAHGGHLDVLQWARANGCPWDVHTCDLAVTGGHLAVLQWAMANDCPGADQFSSRMQRMQLADAIQEILGEIGTVRTRLYKVRLSELVMKLKERNSSAEMSIQECRYATMSLVEQDRAMIKGLVTLR